MSTLRLSSRVTYSAHWLATAGCKLSIASYGTVTRLEVFLGRRLATVTWDSGESVTMPVNGLTEV